MPVTEPWKSVMMPLVALQNTRTAPTLRVMTNSTKGGSSGPRDPRVAQAALLTATLSELAEDLLQ